VILHIDEAYAEYAIPEPGFESVVDWQSGQQNLVVTRTFSKAYGLAGLRIGWLVAHSSVVDAIDRFRTPFNANIAAQVAAISALEHQEWLRQVVNDNRKVRNEFVARLIELGLEVIPSVTNFVLMRFPPDTGKSGSDAYHALEAQGYLARPTESGDAYLRITMGTAHQMEDVARIIGQYLMGKLL
jgi:histidinol-phosphate aminotransferase